jgi:hypothetical protein
LFGQPVTFTATVAAVAPGSGTPAGLVAFLEGSTTLGTATLSNGKATFTTSDLSVGNHVISAVYQGGSSVGFTSSTSPALTQTVNSSTIVNSPLTATTLAVLPNPGLPAPGTANAPVTLTATVTGVASGSGTPTGTVDFREGSTTLATVSLSNGVAAFTTSTLTLGQHTLTAVYNGDSNFNRSTSPSVVAAIGTINQRFVAQAFRDLLHREVDPFGLTAFTAALAQGLSRPQVVYAIQRSPEYFSNQVQALYARLLHRTVDGGGLTTFSNFLAAGGTLEQAQMFIVASPEYFLTRGGGTNDGFLNALYLDAFQRGIDPIARTTFNQLLAGGVSRDVLVTAIFGSPEYLQDLIQGHYNQFLHRTADPGGLSAFLTARQRGAQDEQVVAAIEGSDEALARF